MKKSFKYPKMNDNGESRDIHRVLAERAFGGPLPPGAVVHHVDEDPSNYARGNLVICPDQAYHKLLHRRTDALNACGNASYIQCCFCKKYDHPDIVVFPKRSSGELSGAHHKSCKIRYDFARNQAKKEQLQ